MRRLNPDWVTLRSWAEREKLCVAAKLRKSSSHFNSMTASSLDIPAPRRRAAGPHFVAKDAPLAGLRQIRRRSVGNVRGETTRGRFTSATAFGLVSFETTIASPGERSGATLVFAVLLAPRRFFRSRTRELLDETFPFLRSQLIDRALVKISSTNDLDGTIGVLTALGRAPLLIVRRIFFPTAAAISEHLDDDDRRAI